MSTRSFKFEILSSDGKKYIDDIDELYVHVKDLGMRGFLKGHVPFICTLDISTFYIVKNNEKFYFSISGGILNFKKDLTIILADTFESKNEIDKDRAINEKTEAENKLLEHEESEYGLKEAEFSLKKAINRLSLFE